MKYKQELHQDFIEYLLRLFENENKRLEVIESKISQIISQSGIIISLVSFLIPFLYDRLVNENCLSKIIISLLFLVSISLFGLSIYQASKVYKVSSFTYMDCSPNTINQKYKTIEDFKNEYIEDLKKSIENNKKTNNKKATHLINANYFFVFGIYSLIFLSIILVIRFLM